MIGFTFALLVYGASFLLVGYQLGRRYRRGAGPRPPAPPPEPICMCGHNFSNHEDGGYKCQTAVMHPILTGSKIGSCACRIYVGPDPVLSGHWHPPIKEKQKPAPTKT
jgi:hypothetical protein